MVLTGARVFWCWLTCRSARTILTSRRFRPKLLCRSGFLYFTLTRKLVFRFPKNRHPGLRCNCVMTAKSGRIKRSSVAANISWPRRAVYFSTVLITVLGAACNVSERRTMPPEVETAIASVGEDIAAERYEKIYNESSELWKQAATLEESVNTFKTLRTKLGTFESRTLQSAT